MEFGVGNCLKNMQDTSGHFDAMYPVLLMNMHVHIIQHVLEVQVQLIGSDCISL